MNAIQTEKLTKYYGRSRGIVELDLQVPQGDFFGFIGPNGAGKSTLIRTLLGLIHPTSGSAQVFELDVTKHSKEILARTGYLPGEANFYGGMTVKQQLTLCAKLRGADCANEAARLCDRLSLDPDRKIDQLSLGNRKKVGIVAALQHSPELIVMDEPTSGLDPLMQRVKSLENILMLETPQAQPCSFPRTCSPRYRDTASTRRSSARGSCWFRTAYTISVTRVSSAFLCAVWQICLHFPPLKTYKPRARRYSSFTTEAAPSCSACSLPFPSRIFP